MIMIAGRRKVQKDGHMQIACHTSGNLRPMSWVGVHFIFRLPLYIFILGAPHPFNPGSPRNDQPHRPNIRQTRPSGFVYNLEDLLRNFFIVLSRETKAF